MLSNVKLILSVQLIEAQEQLQRVEFEAVRYIDSILTENASPFVWTAIRSDRIKTKNCNSTIVANPKLDEDLFSSFTIKFTEINANWLRLSSGWEPLL